MSLVKLDIESWCNNNDILKIEAEPLNQKNTNIFICNETSHENFLELALKNEVKHIVITEIHFDLLEECSEEIESRIDSSINVDAFVDNILSEYKLKDGEVKVINIYWNKEGISYLFIHIEEWYENFLQELDFHINNSIQLLDASKPQSLPDTIYKNLIIKIASSDLYFINNTRPQNFEMVLFEFIEELEIDRSKFFINSLAVELDVKKLFNRKYKRVKEVEFIEKIKTMRANGNTKNNIISKLGITEGIYDRLANV